MREVSTFVYESTPAFFSDPLFLKYADAADGRRRSRSRRARRRCATAQRAALQGRARGRRAGTSRSSSDAGVTIAMGTDTGPPARFQGYFELMELELMVKAGPDAAAGAAAATRDAARCMKLDSELGTLEAGKWADFVVLDADPLADIANIKKIDSV